MTQALLLNKPSHQPKIVKSPILWLVELRAGKGRNRVYHMENWIKLKLESLENISYFISFIYLGRKQHMCWGMCMKVRGQLVRVNSLPLQCESEGSNELGLAEECTASPFSHWVLSAIHVTSGILFLQLESSSSQVCVWPRATCMGSGTHATTNLQRSEDNLWWSVHSIPPGLRQVSHHYASQTSWPSSLLLHPSTIGHWHSVYTMLYTQLLGFWGSELPSLGYETRDLSNDVIIPYWVSRMSFKVFFKKAFVSTK